MLDPTCFVKGDDPERTGGLVYRDRAQRDKPATHVFIAGVGAYLSPEFAKPLRTAAISARTLADWFLGAERRGFSNPRCELGSAALLLSELPNGEKSQYLGGDVPRAAFDTVKTAVRAWLDRIDSHKDNLAILYIASHGHSFLNRTAFMLEDYGLDRHDVTAGMSEVEQFISALQFARPVRQLLLFDCCRSPTRNPLSDFQDFGTKLISKTKPDDDHGEPRKQWVICSTSLGNEAIGLANGPTLFNMALLDALGGVAADPSEDGWPVRPGALVEKMDKLLSLHRLPGEKPQTPAGRFGGGFELTFAGEAEQVPVYVALDDPGDWADSTIQLSVNGEPLETVNGAEGQSPFVMRRAPQFSVVEVVAQNGARLLGKSRRKVQAPASFIEIEKQPAIVVTDQGPLSNTRPLNPKSKVLIDVRADIKIDKGAIAEIVPQSFPGARTITIPVTLGGQTSVDLDAGDHQIILRTPDGRVQRQDITLPPRQAVKIDFDTEPSPHEWMAAATVTGLRRGAVSHNLQGSTKISVVAVGALDMNLNASSDSVLLDIVTGPTDSRFARFDFYDSVAARFVEQQLSPWAAVVFVRMTSSAGREELAVVPTLGPAVYTGWAPHLICDLRASDSEAVTTVGVEDQQWTSLIGFLATRNFAAGAALLESGLGRSAIAAMRDKISNPLAAVAGSLIAVSVSTPDSNAFWNNWLLNIANWFPGIPDGAIVVGRQMLVAARTPAETAKARHWLETGYRRGVPVYSLSADWLAQGLEALPGDDEDLVRMRRQARRLCMRIDPTHAFTVVRVK